jgi:peptidoglycan/xylan/chitin deacetylase (PgdA/CDA1 family)
MKEKKTKSNTLQKLGVALLLIIALYGAFWAGRISIDSPKQVLSNLVSATDKQEPIVSKIEEFQVSVLMYHYIRVADPSDRLGLALSVTPTNFDAQIKWLKDNNYQSMNLAELADPQKGTISKIIASGKKPVVITFDDGYDDAYTQATPILEKHGFTGTFFIIRNFIGKTGYASENQINQMANAGMEIGSHSLDHKDLAKNSLEITHKQIFDSKLDSEVFCYPSGRFSPDSVNLVKEAGYKVAVTTLGGIANQDSNLFELPRVRITNTDLETFAKRVQGLK